MKILVTGSQGFIGSYLVRSLLDAGHSVRGLDKSVKHSPQGGYEVINSSILNGEATLRAMDDVECIIHLAAEHKDQGISKEQYFQVNQIGTHVLLECATEAGVVKIIFFSTVAVYGGSGAADEGKLPQPTNNYGASKLAAEAEIAIWTAEGPDRKAVVIRPSVVFGPSNYANIYRLIKKISDGEFWWPGHGRNVKSVAYVENLVSATLFLMDRMPSGIAYYNYSDEPQHTMKELVNLIAEKAEQQISRFYFPFTIVLAGVGLLELIGRVIKLQSQITVDRLRKFCQHTEYPAEKIRSLGFRQPFSLEEGIAKTVGWYLKSVKQV